MGWRGRGQEEADAAAGTMLARTAAELEARRDEAAAAAADMAASLVNKEAEAADLRAEGRDKEKEFRRGVADALAGKADSEALMRAYR